MKGKYMRALALGLVLSLPMFLAGCATAPPTQLSILDVFRRQLDEPNRNPARHGTGTTVCVQTMRLKPGERLRSCMDKRQFMDGRFGGGF